MNDHQQLVAKLVDLIEDHPQVRHVATAEPVEREFTLTVVLDPFSWEAHDHVIGYVDDFGRDHLHEVSVTAVVLDVAQAAHLTPA